MTRAFLVLQPAVLAVALLALASPAAAQTPGTHPDRPMARGAVADTPPPSLPDKPTTRANEMTLKVVVTHGDTKKPLAHAPVFLRAARPRGPFEPTEPKPKFEWSGFTNEKGVAVFDQVPQSLTTSGLRVHAVTTYNGVAFESAASMPASGTSLTIQVWESSLDTSGIVIDNLRTIVDIWEGYLVFTQFYTIKNEGKTTLDVSSLPGDKYQKGLPFDLPVKAKGITVSGPGETKSVNSSFYWKGVLTPGAKVNLQVRFSMTAKNPEFTYEQTVGYPTNNVQVAAPIQTRYEKVPRLDNLELRPPGFAKTDRGKGIFGLRNDIEFIGATGLKLKPGQSFRFQLRGLPFHQPKLPWVFLGIGLLFGLLIFLLSRRELAKARTTAATQEMLEALQSEREALLEELVALEQDFDEGVVTHREYDAEAEALRERLALVLKKIQDLE